MSSLSLREARREEGDTAAEQSGGAGDGHDARSAAEEALATFLELAPSRRGRAGASDAGGAPARYPVAAKRAAVRWADAAQAEGASVADVCATLGVAKDTLRAWRKAAGAALGAESSVAAAEGAAAPVCGAVGGLEATLAAARGVAALLTPLDELGRRLVLEIVGAWFSFGVDAGASRAEAPRSEGPGIESPTPPLTPASAPQAPPRLAPQGATPSTTASARALAEFFRGVAAPLAGYWFAGEGTDEAGQPVKPICNGACLGPMGEACAEAPRCAGLLGLEVVDADPPRSPMPAETAK